VQGSEDYHLEGQTAWWLGGPLQAFLETLWGGATCDYMAVLCQVPPEVMEQIVADARSIATNHKVKSMVQSEKPHSEHAALQVAFC
jgi:hypothetical protein